MNQILRCDWLPELARWSYLARSRVSALSRKKNFSERYIKNALLTKVVWSRWLDICQVIFLRVYGPRALSQSINTPIDDIYKHSLSVDVTM